MIEERLLGLGHHVCDVEYHISGTTLEDFQASLSLLHWPGIKPGPHWPEAKHLTNTPQWRLTRTSDMCGMQAPPQSTQAKNTVFPPLFPIKGLRSCHTMIKSTLHRKDDQALLLLVLFPYGLQRVTSSELLLLCINSYSTHMKRRHRYYHVAGHVSSCCFESTVTVHK